MAHVLIVGGGPGGAALAHLLAHRGVDVTLLERQRDFAREFRGEVLVPSGLIALEAIGVGSRLADIPTHRPARTEIFFDRRPVLQVAFAPDLFGGRPPLAVSQPALLEMMVSEAAKSGRLHFERGVSVKDLLWEGDRVVGVRARTEAGEVEFRADLVVGADGRASIVRRRAPLQARASAPPMDVVWCKLPLPEGFDGARFCVGRAHLVVAYRSWDGKLQVAWAILKGTYGALRQRGIEAWVREMAKTVPPDWADHFHTHADNLHHPFLLDTVSDRVERWSVPGALVIGDAAHTMSPVGAQGVNVALRDAIVAANHLVPVLQRTPVDPKALDAAARAVGHERAREIVAVQRLQALPPRLVMSQAWWGQPLRRLAAGVLGSGLPARFGGGGAVRPFLYGTARVELRV